MSRHRVGFTGLKIKIHYLNQTTTDLDRLVQIGSNKKKRGRAGSEVARTHEHP